MPEIMAHPFYLRNDFIPKTGRRPPIVSPPRIEDIAHPIKQGEEIERDILRNLLSLWQGSTEDEIVAALVQRDR